MVAGRAADGGRHAILELIDGGAAGLRPDGCSGVRRGGRRHRHFGGIVLLWMGYTTARSALRGEVSLSGISSGGGAAARPGKASSNLSLILAGLWPRSPTRTGRCGGRTTAPGMFLLGLKRGFPRPGGFFLPATLGGFHLVHAGRGGGGHRQAVHPRLYLPGGAGRLRRVPDRAGGLFYRPGLGLITA